MKVFTAYKNTLQDRESIAVIILLFNAFSWHYLCRLTINRFGCMDETLYLNTAYSISIMVSAIAGVALLKGLKRLLILKTWILLGSFTSPLVVILSRFNFWGNLAVVSLLGASLGFAIPFCMDLLIRTIAIENRGKAGGTILFATFSSFLALYRSVFLFDLLTSGLLLSLWRLWSLPLAFLVSEERLSKDKTLEKNHTFASVLKNRAFLLYFTAWLMFSLIDGFQTVVMNFKAAEFAFFMKIVEPCVAAFSALFVGAILDVVGRKRVLVFIFIFLGVAYAVLGLFPYSLISWIFYSVADGVAIGLAFVLFMIVIWGEISVGNSVKFYALGGIPFFLAEILSLVLEPFLILVPQSSALSLASFFLFIAVIPLVFAPETLPERVLRERELRSYIEWAKRVREKFTKG